MRSAFRIQRKLSSVYVGEINLPHESRATLYPILRSLQELYGRKDLVIPRIMDDLSVERKRNLCRGKPGMSGWQVLVLSAIRMNLGHTFEEMEVMFNQDKVIRLFLELDEDDDRLFSSRSLGDNYRLVKTETLDFINAEILKLAEEKNIENGKVVRADSFACETDIHYPTDQSLILDTCRKIIELCRGKMGSKGGWRQSKHLLKKIKKLSREVSSSKKGGGKGKSLRVKSAYGTLLAESLKIQKKAEQTYRTILEEDSVFFLLQLNDYLNVLKRVMSVCHRRTQLGENISSGEKMYSIFERDTELINRGKFPNPIEFGHRVLLAQGQSGMILSYKVMDNGSMDRDELNPLLKQLAKRYGKIDIASLDKGFWYKDAIQENAKHVEKLVIAKKGKPNQESKLRESDTEFVKYRQWRSGVEALISSCVRTNGLKRCRDKGKHAYKRWVATAVLTRNLITLGKILLEEEREKKKPA